MRRSLKKRNPIPLRLIITILIIATLMYMIYTIFSNFETPLTKAQYIKDGQQYNTLINENDLVSYSNTFLGMKYLWGGTTPAILDSTGKYISGGFDCSGFVQYVYKNFGVNLPRTSMDQVNKGVAVKINNLEKDINNLKTLIASWVPIPSDGGASLKTLISSWFSSKIIITRQLEIENTKVSHGS